MRPPPPHAADPHREPPSLSHPPRPSRPVPSHPASVAPLCEETQNLPRRGGSPRPAAQGGGRGQGDPEAPGGRKEGRKEAGSQPPARPLPD